MPYSCLKFAKALEEQGILTLDRLKKLPQSDAIEVLEGCGMKKLQVRAVMEAFNPPSFPAPAPDPKVLFTLASFRRPNFFIRFADCLCC